MVWYSHLFQNFPQFAIIYTIKGSGMLNKADAFLELSCFIDYPTDAGSLISGSYAFSKSRLFMWKFLVHIMVGITNLKRRGTTRERGLSSK